ncbi:collagen-like protein [Gelidibacter salicanalis]|uniref:Collagen-like protein n=1 Tax=Gelidibacter salicanalis TaxID=291193 RepID=A0A934KWK4_9FLAO|nr:collagen-like protein [Gelidibacter salicanalis]MBJ7881648.1 hypothetical protein [Gelidibacter salicanalis]
MKKLLLLLTLLTGNFIFAQVGIGTDVPNASSQLEIKSSNRGVLIPQIALTGTTDQETITAGNVESLLVYNTTDGNAMTPGYYYWSQDSWKKLSTGIDVPDNIVYYDIVNNQFTSINQDGDVIIIGDADPETLTFLRLNADGFTLEYSDEKGALSQVDLRAIVKNFETVTSLVDNTDGTITYTNESNDKVVIDVATGIQGPKGDPGEPGVQGPQGPLGPVGPKGEDGINFGEPGPKGDKGDPGVAGPAGPQGPAGPIGPQGDLGPEGPEGPVGDEGPRGIQGLQGIPGPLGPAGPVGPRGETGLAGPQGIRGPEGPQGSTGPQGPIGPDGIRGPEGPQGATGPAGPQGDQGITGATGAAGPEGPVGPTGLQGPRGLQGLKGDTGAQGEKGDKGDKGDQGEPGVGQPTFFYMPPVMIYTEASQVPAGETFGTIDLYAEYQQQFGTPLVVNPGATTTIPVLPSSQLDYSVTWYDTTIFENVAVSDSGILTYSVKATAAPEDTSSPSEMTIVLTVKP